MRHLIAPLLSATIFLSPASWAITIDQLSEPQSASLSGASQTATSNNSAKSGSVIGGRRGILINKAAAPLGLSVQVAGGILYHTQDFGVTGNSLITWDGDRNPDLVTANGLGSINLLADGATALRVKVEAADAPVELVFTAYDANDPLGFHSSRGRITIASPVTAPTLIDLPFSSFTEAGLAGPASFSSIGALTLFINGASPGIRLALSFIGTNGSCAHIPVHGFIVDQCGVCEGNGLSCVKCKTKNQGALLQSLDDGAVRQSDIIAKIIAAYQATAEGKRHRTWAARTLERTRKIEAKNINLAHSFPQRIKSCTNAEVVCTHVSYTDVTAQYGKRNTELRDIAREALLRLEGINEISQATRSLFLKEANLRYRRNLKLLAKIGDTQDKCPKH